MKSSERIPGTHSIHLPGENEYQTAERYRLEGIPMPLPVLRDLQRLARDLGARSDLPDILG
jgi:LDH2 family malate/lactate/ureidoglycolate dehydrogenase